MESGYQFIRLARELVFESFEYSPEDNFRWSIVWGGVESSNSVPENNPRISSAK